MPLINKPTARTVKTVVEEIKRNNTILFNAMKATHNGTFRTVWQNKDFTPAEIISEFGTDAVALFQNSSAIQAILKAVDPDYKILTLSDKYIVTPNQDGTVTITEKPE